MRGSKLDSIRVGGKTYTTETAIRTFISTLSTVIEPVEPSVTETTGVPQSSSEAIISESLSLAKQHLDQVLGCEATTTKAGGR